MRPGETPVPIPNTMVKTWTADGTILETIWESRWLPEHTEKPYSDQGIYARGARGMDVLDDCMAVRERDVPPSARESRPPQGVP